MHPGCGPANAAGATLTAGTFSGAVLKSSIVTFEAVEVRRAGERNGVPRPPRRDAPAVEDDQHQRQVDWLGHITRGRVT